MRTHRHSSSRLGRTILTLAGLISALCATAARPQTSSQQSQSKNAPQNSGPLVPLRKPDAKKARQSYQEGLKAEQGGDWNAAYSGYSEAVEWATDNRDYLMHRETAKSRLVQLKIDQAERSAVMNRMADARKSLLEARYLDPTNSVVRDRLAELSAMDLGQTQPAEMQFEPQSEVRLDYTQGKHNFDYRGDAQGVYQEAARVFGVEVAFDVDLPSHPVRLQVNEVDFLTAMRIIGDMTKTFWRPLTSRLFFVSPDTPQKRKDYDTSVVRTVVLPASETPDQMTETLRLVREIAGITRSDLDARTRTLTMRASPQEVAVATGLVDELEKPGGELILEIELLDVDRDYARQLGITPPENTHLYTLSPQQITEAQQSLSGLVDVITQVFGQPSSLSGLTGNQITSLLSAGQLSASSLLPPLVALGGGQTTFLATVPNAAANFQQMLSLVQHGRRILLRAEDGQPATFFVGDRVPVSLATYASSFNGTSTGINGVSSTQFPTTNYTVGIAPTFVSTASLRNNSSNDLIVTNFTDSTISVLLNNNDTTGTFASQVTYPTGTGPSWITTGTFNTTNGRQVVDLAVANETANTISILLGNGDGTFQAKTDLTAGNSPVSVAAARLHDLSATSNLDLVVANHGDNTLSLLTGNGDGTFQPPATLALPNGFGPSSIAVADFNGDGHLDLAVTDEGNATVSIFLGNGDGTFKPRTDYATGNSPVWVSVGDFNGDGINDLAVANKNDDTVSILLGNASASSTSVGNGTFAPQTVFPAGGSPTSIAVADFNIDGREDMAITDETDNAISILLGIGGGSFGPNFELPVETSPVAITTADFNGDGKPDVAAANNGSNSVSVITDSASFSGSSVNSSAGVPFPGIQYMDVGIKIKATPRIHPDNQVTLQLDIESSTLSTQNFNAIPVINSDTVSQTVRVKENETAALAGILQANVINAITGTPGVAEIPGVGLTAATSNDQNQDTELLILVTPRLVRLAPRADHTIYAGQGSLDNGAAPAPTFVPPPQPAPPTNPPEQIPGQAPPPGAQPAQPNPLIQPQQPGAQPVQPNPIIQPQQPAPDQNQQPPQPEPTVQPPPQQ